MAKYKITFKKSVAKDLCSIPNQDVQRILSRIDALQENPRAEGCIKLSGQERYRVRLEVYRILYKILDERLVIHVVKLDIEGVYIKPSSHVLRGRSDKYARYSVMQCSTDALTW